MRSIFMRATKNVFFYCLSFHSEIFTFLNEHKLPKLAKGLQCCVFIVFIKPIYHESTGTYFLLSVHVVLL